MINHRSTAACVLLVAACTHSVAAQEQAEPQSGGDEKPAMVSAVETPVPPTPAATAATEPAVNANTSPSSTPVDKPVSADESVSDAPDVEKEMGLADVIALVQQQQALLAAQGEQLKAQSKQIASLSDELDALRTPSPGLVTEEAKPDTDKPGPSTSIAQLGKTEEQNTSSIESVKQQQKTEQEKTDNEVATTQADDPTRAMQDDFPGAWRLPGTQAALAIGGYVKMAAVGNYDPLAIQDRFIVGSIPVGDGSDNDRKAEVSLSAAQSRLNFDLREPTDYGIMRAFIEGDFAGDGDQFRLRHAFGQWNRVLAGKTWSAFMDTQATPEEVDFEGLNGRLNVRQAQLRFSPHFGEKFSLIASLEDPNPQVQGGDGISRLPDLVLAGRFEPSDRLHMKLSVLGRQIHAEYTEAEGDNVGGVEKEYAWGLSASGRFKTPYLEQRDSVLFQLSYGNAIGRYVNDLSSVGSFDGIFDDQGQLELFDIFAGYVSYQHWWGSNTRSNVTVGVVDLNNPGFVEGDAYKRTIRSSASWIWTPTPRVDIGVELLWGERENEDGDTGNASQTQVMARYRFSQ